MPTPDPCHTCGGAGVKPWEALTAEERACWIETHILIQCLDCTISTDEFRRYIEEATS